jgi:anti-sigma regulatory factor (Ser/Thr protein kinase)
MVSALVADVERFREGTEQEDDITLVVVNRSSSAEHSAQTFADTGDERVLTSFEVASEEGNERIAIEKVSAVVGDLDLAPDKVERLKTAVGESVMNAMEHGNQFRSELPVTVEVRATDDHVLVRISDHGHGPRPGDVSTPDIEAKLTGEQTPRGWGLFLIEKMVDELRTEDSDGVHTLELVIKREGARE